MNETQWCVTRWLLRWHFSSQVKVFNVNSTWKCVCVCPLCPSSHWSCIRLLHAQCRARERESALAPFKILWSVITRCHAGLSFASVISRARRIASHHSNPRPACLPARPGYIPLILLSLFQRKMFHNGMLTIGSLIMWITRAICTPVLLLKCFLFWEFLQISARTYVWIYV